MNFHMKRLLLFPFLIAVLTEIFFLNCASQPQMLVPNRPIERKARNTGHVTYQFELPGRTYTRLQLEQINADVMMTVYSPSKRELCRRDSLNGQHGTESISFVSSEAGLHLLEVTFLSNEKGGSYRLTMESPRVPSMLELAHAQAFELLARGKRLSKEPDPDKYAEALESFAGARELWRRLGEREQEALALLEEAVIWGHLQESERQVECLERATSASQALNQPQFRAMIQFRMGVAHFRRGRFEKAIQAYNSVLDIRTRRDVARADILLEQGFTHVVAGQLAEAIGFFKDAERIYTKEGHIPGLARIYRELGWVDYLEGNYERAIGHLKRAHRLIKGRKDPVEVGILDRLGTCLAKTQNFSEAMRAYQQALVLVPKARGSDWTPILHANMGELLVDQGQYDAGLELLEQARTRFEAKNMPAELAHAYYNCARAKQALKRYEEALAEAEKTLEISESLRTDAKSQHMRAAYRASRFKYSDFYLELFLEVGERRGDGKGYQIQALTYLEHIRARNLVENLSREDRDASPENLKLLERARFLQAKIATRAWQRSQMLHSKGVTSDIDLEIDRLLRRYDGVWTELHLSQENGEHYISELRVEEIQGQMLDEETVLLFYGLGQKFVWLWVVEHNDVTLLKLGSRQVIEANAREYYKRINNQNVNRFRSRIKEVGAELSRTLLGPAFPKIKGKRLLITTDGDLQYIPFGALPTPDESESPMINQGEIIHLYSASALATIMKRNETREPATGGVVILADPNFTPASGFARLINTREEAQAIAELANDPPAIFLGCDASKANVHRREIGNAKYLHFATHGLLYPNRGELSALVLAGVNCGGNTTDEFLRSYEIRELKLSADLVVLSACETALGEEIRGEGLVGLPQSFLEAGAGGVLVSLWRVDDWASKELMVRFYRYLLVEGLAPAAALRHAQMKLRQKERWRDPYYWSGFIFYGDWREPVKKKW